VLEGLAAPPDALLFPIRAEDLSFAFFPIETRVAAATAPSSMKRVACGVPRWALPDRDLMA